MVSKENDRHLDETKTIKPVGGENGITEILGNGNDVLEQFTPLFNPKSIAIIGVSKNPLGGLKYYNALKYSGYVDDPETKVYLINPKYKDTGLLGEKVYGAIDDPEIPSPVDLAIIAVPAQYVPDVLLQCNGKVRFAVVYSSGFGESGKGELDHKLKETIAEIDTRVIGPNCLGILNPYRKVSIYPKWAMFKGNISYISQSGGTMARLYVYLGTQGIGFRNVVSIGNAADVSINELLRYFYYDGETKAIALYLESIKNGRDFFNLARLITPKKPIILFKGGQTDRGKSAALSHTGGLAGSYRVWSAMARQSGIMMADHFELFADMVQVAAVRPSLPKNLNVAILVAGGGIGVEFTDNFIKSGLNVVNLRDETIEALAKAFPDVNTNFRNPIDLGEYGYVPGLFAKALKIVLKDPNIENVVFVREPERFPIISTTLGIEDPEKETIKSIMRVLKRSNKPIFCNLSPNSLDIDAYTLRKSFQDKMIAAGIPVIGYFKNIPHIIKELHYYGKYLKSIE